MHYYHKNGNGNSVKCNLSSLRSPEDPYRIIKDNGKRVTRSRRGRQQKSTTEVREHCAQAKPWKNNPLKRMSELKNTEQ